MDMDLDCLLDSVEHMCQKRKTVDSLTLDLNASIATIQAAVNNNYSPWRVYVTFNQQWQRDEALEALDLSGYEVSRLNSRPAGPQRSPPNKNKVKALFKGRVLDVKPAEEPDEIIYESSNRTFLEKSVSLCKSYLLCGAFVAIVYYIQAAISSNSTTRQYVAAFISIVNSILPKLVSKVTETFELHSNTSSKQLSSMLKLTIVRSFECIFLPLFVVFVPLDYLTSFSPSLSPPAGVNITPTSPSFIRCAVLILVF